MSNVTAADESIAERSTDDAWYCRLNGAHEVGPLSSADLRALVKAGRLQTTDQVQRTREGRWFEAVEIPGLFDVAVVRRAADDTRDRRLRQAIAFCAGLLASALVFAFITLRSAERASEQVAQQHVPDPPEQQPAEVRQPIVIEVHAAAAPAQAASPPQAAAPRGVAQAEHKPPAEAAPRVAAEPPKAPPAAIVEKPVQQPAARPAIVIAPPQEPLMMARAPLMPNAAPAPGQGVDPEVLRRLSEFQRLSVLRRQLLTDAETSRRKLEVQQQETAAAQAEWNSFAAQRAAVNADMTSLQQTINSLQIEGNIARQNANAGTQAAISADLQQCILRMQQLTTRLSVVQGTLAELERKLTTLQKQNTESQQHLTALQQQSEVLWRDWLELVDPFDQLNVAQQQAVLPWLTQAINDDDKHGGALLARAVVYRRLGQDRDAVQDLDAAIRLGAPYAIIGYALRGSMSLASGSERDGLSDFGQALKIDKKNAYVYMLRALGFCRAEKFAAAEKDFLLASRLPPCEADAFRCLALLWATSANLPKHDATKALNYARQACEKTQSKDWHCLLALAAAQAEDGKFDDAIKTADHAAALCQGENRDRCLAQRALYEKHQPLRMNWRE